MYQAFDLKVFLVIIMLCFIILLKGFIVRKVKNVMGQKFGKLTVVSRNYDVTYNGNAFWFCQCECGKKTIVMGSRLIHGRTKSCGCLRKLNGYTNPLSHGHAIGKKKSKTYMIWANMINRCTNPAQKSYPKYGGRGISVCQRWRESFENFLEDMGEKPEGLSIDRIDNNGNYEKDNCRWTTKREQLRNYSRNRMITFNGKTQCLTDWAEEIGIDRQTISSRLYRGWSIEKAIVTPKFIPKAHSASDSATLGDDATVGI